MDRLEDVSSAFVELQDSHNYSTMDDMELYRRFNYWKMERDFLTRSDRNMEEVRQIVLRLALEITERTAAEKFTPR